MKGIFDKPPSRVLMIDFEVGPHFGGFYDGYETTPVSIDRLQWCMSVAYKWLGDDRTYAFGQTDFPEWKKDRFDDSAVMRKAWDAMNKADIVVAHNAKKFDIRKANTRFLMNDMEPPRPYKVVDTLQIARRYFSFPRNSLDELSRYFGIGKKSDKKHSDLWQSCMSGDKPAWKHLKEYNIHDVILLEGIYRKMVKYMENFPVVHPDNGKCRKCGGTRIHKRGNYYYSNKTQAPKLQCLGCGSWSRGSTDSLLY